MRYKKPKTQKLINTKYLCERYCLKTVYWCDRDEKQIDLIMDICDHFGIERHSVYNKKNKAVDHLSLLLYGK